MQPNDLDEAIRTLRDNIHLSSVPLGHFDMAQYLGRSGDNRVLPVLLEALAEGGSYIRSSSALGLGYLGNHKAIPHLLNAFLNDPEVYVRGDAALGLGLLGAEEALSTLEQRFASEDFEVQKRVLMAIPYLKTKSARSTLDKLEIQIQEIRSQERKDFLETLIEQAKKQFDEY
jgi:HEAT repeat protein